MRDNNLWLGLVFCLASLACSGDEKSDNGNGEEKSPWRAKTLLQWLRGPGFDTEEGEGENVIATDRPDFTESSANLSRGRLQLEMGYSYFRGRQDGVTQQRHSYPELNVRYGLIDWLELRAYQNLGTQLQAFGQDRTRASGAEDLQLALGVAFTLQKGWIPESKANFQTRVPTGADAFTLDRLGPGINYLYGWNIIEDKFSIGGSTQFNRLPDENGNFYTEWAQSLTTNTNLTQRLKFYLESFALFPSGAQDGVTGPEYYLNGGFTYLVNNDFQLDIRAGVGLNRHAQDFFTGVGLSKRY